MAKVRSVNLTKNVKNTILGNALEAKRKSLKADTDELQELKQKLNDRVVRIYQERTKPIKDVMTTWISAGDAWGLSPLPRLYFRISETEVLGHPLLNLKADENNNFYYPAHWEGAARNNPIQDTPRDLLDLIREVQRKECMIEQDVRDTRGTVSEILEKVRTTRQLLNAWPAAEHLLPLDVVKAMHQRAEKTRNPANTPEPEKCDDLNTMVLTARMAE